MLILASGSPRRQELLRNAAIEFVVYPAEIPEIPRPDEPPQACAERLACEKALAAHRQLPGNYVLAADTIVIVDGTILGKPRDACDAQRMLRLLSGRSHQVTTGVCLMGPDFSGLGRQIETDNRELRSAFADTRSETTLVTFDKLTHADIQFYISTGEPLDKAGSYAIQGIASRWISHIKGDYCNVVGLPVALVYRMLRHHGVKGIGIGSL